MIDVPDIQPKPAMRVAGAPGRKVFVAVGIDRYRSWPALSNAVRDASAARLLLRHLGFEEAHAPLLDEQATGAALHALVTDDLMSLGAGDSLVVFYAGHGGTRIQPLAGRQIQTGYLIPSDAENEPNRVATWIDLDSWLRKVSLLPPRHILVILDACHSGIALTPVRWRDVACPRPELVDALAAPRSRRIITSARADETALDSGPVAGHSLFTGWLIQALTGGIAGGERAATTGSELGLYLQLHVRDYPGSRQIPDFGAFDGDERGEMPIPVLHDRVTAELLVSRAALLASIAQNARSAGPTAAPGAVPTVPPSAPPASRPPVPARDELSTTPALWHPARDCPILRGPDLATIREAILDAFDRSSFDRLLSDHLSYDREREVGGGSLQSIVYEVIRDVHRKGRIAMLMAAAAIERPHNAAIRHVYSRYCVDQGGDG